LNLNRGDPWIGSGYADSGILIVGESSWGVQMSDADYVSHWLEHPNFAQDQNCAICTAVGGTEYPRDRLFDALTTMMVGWKQVNSLRRHESWARISFTNFIARTLASRSTDDRPTDLDWDEAAAIGFPSVLSSLRPRVCLLLDNPSKKLSRLCGPVIESVKARLVCLPHPTMRPAPTRDERLRAWHRVETISITPVS
jgi:hypothetical protein